MGKISDALTYGLTVRESADDGSDFPNPAADYRRLFLGEDGNLHLKDSAGTVTAVGGAGGSVATDTIWDAAGDLAVGTGANTAARVAKGAAGANLSTYNGVVAWNGGTSFPATPATGDRYWRSDLGMEAYYDGTRWLTTQAYSLALRPTDQVLASTTTGRRHRMTVPYKGTYGLYLQTLQLSTLALATNDGSNYYSIALYSHDSGDSTSQLGSTVTTAADTQGVWYTKTITVNAVLSTGAFAFSVQQTNTGSPNGGLYLLGEMFYRLILT